MYRHPRIERELAFRERNENHPLGRLPHRKTEMQRIEKQKTVEGRVLSGDAGTRMAMMVVHAFLGTRMIPWCVDHDRRTPMFDFLETDWGSKWRMVKPPVSPEQDAVGALEDLGRLPRWSGKLIRRISPTRMVSRHIPPVPKGFRLIEALGSGPEIHEPVLSLVGDGCGWLVCTRDPELAGKLPKRTTVMGLPERGDGRDTPHKREYAIWFTALSADRIYTIPGQNNLLGVHYILAGIPRETIIVP